MDEAWAKEHAACFEITPLLESRAGRIQVGYTLELYARLPLEKTPGPERRAEAERAWEELRKLALSLAPAEDRGIRVEIEPRRGAASLRAANEMEPELQLSARVFHAGDYFAPVTQEDRDKLPGLERRLTAMGLRRGHW
jgi:hypothetical protein